MNYVAAQGNLEAQSDGRMPIEARLRLSFFFDSDGTLFTVNIDSEFDSGIKLAGGSGLYYDLELSSDGVVDTFRSTGRLGNSAGTVGGAIYDSAHEGAAGVLEHPHLTAAFGATLEPQ